MGRPDDRSSWTFLTHHARVLLEIARDPESRLRDIAQSIGITERAVQGIVADLHEAGYLAIERVGRRNRYHLNLERGFRHPSEAHAPVRALVELFAAFEVSSPPTAPADSGRAPAPIPS
ncbi:helix-turn-helix transcriptional regulator [Streptosporangium carneum]|uniref:ArsR family transcriptional regulator n=1 Tax=Streptosporangium carneum TaxID=47481 RepID=A0A9W6I1A3_9ACTN|nr:helix-turn-helix domain-containing protein [Streptosporangium carneum]GLK09199.1 ArsR family transcriptional regulator [Streptosporangium carneum]